MPGSTLPPDPRRPITGTIARTERIERHTVPSPYIAPVTETFSYPGALSSGIESPPWYVPRSGQIEMVRVSLLSDATANHVISVHVNGVEQQQITLPSGDKTAVADAAISVGFGEYVTVATVTVFDADMAVEVRLR